MNELSMDKYIGLVTGVNTLERVYGDLSKLERERALRDITSFCKSVSYIDEYNDSLKSNEARDKFRELILNYIVEGNSDLKNKFGSEVYFYTEKLRGCIEKGNLKDFFVKTLSELLNIDAELNEIRDEQTYMRKRYKEGLLIGSAYTKLAEKYFPEMNKSFFLKMGGLYNLGDSFLDLPDDYKSSETMVRPRLAFRLKLLKAVFIGLFKMYRKSRENRKLLYNVFVIRDKIEER